ncbi:hypothetical protein CRUP_004962 [Coryphaenoides rupestris]|nr:hypothetical protein CRUP_004962 [Coryphaenoides rupestris]
MPPPVWMFVCGLLSTVASQACPHPPCRDSLVAALPGPPGVEAGPGTGICEGHAGVRGCRTVVPLPAANSNNHNNPSRQEHRVADIPQVQPKMISSATDVKERVVRLQRCMRSVQDTGAPWSQRQDGDSLAAVLALMAAVLTEYRLTAREYSGDAGNALTYSKRYNHDGRSFSTPDRDHDRYATGNCAQYYGAGWWFDACLAANLNGRYYRGRYSGLTNGVYWGTWYALTDGRTGERHSFKSVEMKTRPRSRLT